MSEKPTHLAVNRADLEFEPPDGRYQARCGVRVKRDQIVDAHPTCERCPRLPFKGESGEWLAEAFDQ